MNNNEVTDKRASSKLISVKGRHAITIYRKFGRIRSGPFVPAAWLQFSLAASNVSKRHENVDRIIGRTGNNGVPNDTYYVYTEMASYSIIADAI